MTPDALEPLTFLAQTAGLTADDAHDLAAAAVMAGASGDEAQQALNEWVAMQGRQVQQVFAEPPRCRCSHGPSSHTGGYGKCHIFVCACAAYRDKEVQ